MSTLAKPAASDYQNLLHGAALAELLDEIGRVRVAVLGDFCLDVYWHLDESLAENSVETGLRTRPVVSQRTSLGGAGNVVANLAALGCGSIHAIGVVADDLWGREMIRLLGGIGVETGHMLTLPEDRWGTMVYAKPHLAGTEERRIDFGVRNALNDDDALRLLAQLEAVLDEVDVVLVNQQIPRSIYSEIFRARLAAIVASHPRIPFIVDSRDYADEFPGTSLKLNAHEAARLTGRDCPLEAPVPRDVAEAAADALFARQQRPVFVTRGPRGCLVRDASGVHEIPGLQILSRTDPVGAGDSTFSGIGIALGLKRTPREAAGLGNYVAGVTVQKLQTTGTASRAEVLAIGQDPDFIYRPELAEDIRAAVYYKHTEIEFVTPWREGFRPQVAIFDHDGTISTLREGWEKIMEPMMIKAILGPAYATANESQYHQIREHVRAYIDRSTGIQTLVQMQGLVKMVREFGFVPADQILDEVGYKRIYNDGLMEMVRGRVEKLRRRELSTDDFAIKGAVRLLDRLSAAGVRLILASGTDEDDVRDEAVSLGYAELFDGGIFGSVGDVTRDAKKLVLDRIMQEIGDVAASGLITFGDGPVEMRETHKRGGLAIGVASDELRRFGMNWEKRTRLIRGGADVILPDFSQLDELLTLLNLQPRTA